MSKSDDVRFTRDGDQFHYLWAARRCLRLLAPSSNLASVTIEGASQTELPTGDEISAGEEVIDVAEYYGSTSLVEATCVRYVQLKHSTVNSTDEWTMSGLAVTLKGFAKRFQELVAKLGSEKTNKKVGFVFATNRPISEDVHHAIEDARDGHFPRDAQASRGLAKYSGLNGGELAAFCALLSVESEHAGFLAQRKALASDLRGYLPDGDSEAFLEIKELVTRKATSEYSDNPSITKLDILRTLGTDEDYLFPAKNQISLPDLVIPRADESLLVQGIVNAGASPVIVHAEGGVGKSVFASRIGSQLPPGSVAVVYDCFGNGEYRAPSHPRHGARQALVQLANELASDTLCRPIVPSSRADETAYFRAFFTRIGQAVTSIQQVQKDALLCIIIDAADNAEMAATEAGETASFARKLIREALPAGVRLVMLCRTHRRHLLKPPSATIQLALQSFSWDETAAKLRGVFPAATNQDVHEFHRLSSQNPRVQATALGHSTALPEMLRGLGPEPKTVDDMIGRLLEHAVHRAKEEVPEELHPKFDRICTALAVLRPMIPLSVVASLVQMDQDNLRSFLADFGQSVLLKGELLQFRDEPTETWFQKNFKPSAEALGEFIELLRPQARTSAYVASALPHLMLQAGQMDELINIALNSSDLPDSCTLESRDVEAQRLHFALRASLRSRRDLDAAKLALAAASLAAAEDRQWKTLQANTDLAGQYLAAEQILGVVTRKEFSAGWRGSHHVYDASILSFTPGFQGDAQSHIRMAGEWLRNMATLPPDQREVERLEVSDIAELVIANLNVYGAESAATTIGRCTNSQFRHTVARLVARRLTDAARLAELDAIVTAGARDTALVAALVLEASQAGHLLPDVGVLNGWKNIRRLVSQGTSGQLDMDGDALSLLSAFAWTVVKLKICKADLVAAVMSRHLGEERLKALGYQHDRTGPKLVKAYLLQATLSGRTSTLVELAHPDWRKALTESGHQVEQREVREFRVRAGALMPWYQLWADLVCRDVSDEEVKTRLNDAEKASAAALQINHWDRHQLKNEIAIAYAEILIELGVKAEAYIEIFRERLAKNQYFTTTLIAIVWNAARQPVLSGLALDISSRVAGQLDAGREQAESRADSWVALARALMSCHKSESKHFFLKSIEVAAKIGDENLWRWSAVLQLAEAASSPNQSEPQLAYRVARAAELTYDFVYRDKHFDWEGTVEAISNLCPASAFAILSRWRDRGFGSCQRLLAKLVEHLASQKRLNPALIAALYGFQAQWSTSEIFSRVMENSERQSDRQQRADFLYQYIEFDQHSTDTWTNIHEAAEKFAVSLPGIESYAQHAEHQNRVAESAKVTNDYAAAPSEPMDWGMVFAGLDISSLSSLTEANRRFRDAREYGLGSDFYVQAANRVSLGTEAKFLQSLRDFPDFELYELRSLLEGLPAAWRKQFSTMDEVRSLVKALVARHSLYISMYRYYQSLPLDLVEREIAIPMDDLILVALEATAETSFQLGAESLFQLVGLLAKRLSRAQACEALDFELTRLESAMEEDVGDGLWSDSLHPPVDISSAAAGYIWAALAAPEAAYRWEAAHVVRALCRLGCEVVVDCLLLWLRTSPPPQMTDKGLVHYRLHANLWLLIGLARAAIDYPDILKKHIPDFVKLASEGEPHVLIRSFAAQAVIAIMEASETEVSLETLARLRSVNEPILSADVPSRKERWQRNHKQPGSTSEVKLHFGLDLPSYWFEPLASRFGLSTSEICSRIQDVILNRWLLTVDRWDDDQRYSREYFKHEDTQHSHGSFPKSEDLRFYLSFHSMMVVAGELLATVPMSPPENDGDDYDTFQYWLRENGLTRPDFRWLVDRRDPEPLDYSDWSDEKDDKTWRWCVTRADFSAILFRKSGMIAVSGRWLQKSGSRRQQVSVSTALVSTDSARAFLVANQTAAGLNWNGSLPRAGGSDDVSVAGFDLSGWVQWQETNNGLDQHDPWCADIHFPGLMPSEITCQLLGLFESEDSRNWYQGERKVLAFKSSTWARQHADNQSDQESNHGLLLEASQTALDELVLKTGKSLIFKVSISRNLSSTYQKDEDQSVKYPSPYVLYFLLNDDEKFTSL